MANFYIKRYDLAAGQLLVLLILIIGTAFGICTPLYMYCCLHWRADNEAAAVSYYVINLIYIIIYMHRVYHYALLYVSVVWLPLLLQLLHWLFQLGGLLMLLYLD